MNRVSGFIISIAGALVRISEYHIILDILIKSRYTAVHTAVRNLNTAAYRGTKYSMVPNTTYWCIIIARIKFSLSGRYSQIHDPCGSVVC